MHLSETTNDHGTAVSVFRCERCGGEFTVCPAVPEEKRDEWNGCLATECPSYDIDRDAELYFLLGQVETEPCND